MDINKAAPYIMHIDLNSCFAIIEQQANRLLRGRPVGVAAYDTPRGFVLAASYEAKRAGIKLGVNVSQARAMCPGIVIMTPDPAKYREAHKRFKTLLLAYTPDVVPKSIDEFTLDLSNSPAIRSGLTMEQIGYEIKQRIRESLGEHVTVNIGIATNRFLAKYAAGFSKPDGMTCIDHGNLRSMYKGMKLVELPGINVRLRARLRQAGIFTPLDFLAADMHTLKKRVFGGINGYYWYLRLRGHEIDNVQFSRKSIGHQYALSDKTADINKLERLLMKLCEKTGRRMRKNDLVAHGIHLYLGFVSDTPILDGPASFENMSNIRSWHHGERVEHRLYSTVDIYDSAKRLLHQAEIAARVKLMAVTVFNLAPYNPVQTSLFDLQPRDSGRLDGTVAHRSYEAAKRISDAVDAVNDRYGEFVITPAAMMDMQGEILDRVAFGQVRDL